MQVFLSHDRYKKDFAVYNLKNRGGSTRKAFQRLVHAKLPGTPEAAKQIAHAVMLHQISMHEFVLIGRRLNALPLLIRPTKIRAEMSE